MEIEFDCSEIFKKLLGLVRFSTYDSFTKAIEDFQKTTHTYYKPTNSVYFPPDTVERNLLSYKYIRYVCEQQKKSRYDHEENLSCPAYFTVGSRNSQLGVVKYYMVHNHEGYQVIERTNVLSESYKIEDDELCPGDVDCTSTFLALFTDKIFDTYAELQARMDEFQRVTGSLYGKRNTKRFPESSTFASTLVYKSFAYECYHYGTHNSDSAPLRARRSAKIGCQSRITVSCYQNKLRIVRFNLKHNHDVAPEHAKAYPRNRRLTPAQLSVVEKMIQSNCDVHTIRDFIANTYKTPCTLSDIRNIKSRLRASARNELSTAAIEITTSDIGEDNEELLHNVPAVHQNDPNIADMISQLTPQLEHIQDLVLSSSSQDIMKSRMKCLGRLIGFWQEGKEAMVLVPTKRIILRGNTNTDAGKTVQQREQHTSPSYFSHVKEPHNVCLGNYDLHDHDDFYQHVTRQENFIS
ncbi:unnamed protein product [Hymenolepis diminuta]|uniref:FAR1 domain-containing protein n=1 Tax=Hymenolepis diminuta TaxID=6216 RepID=A0A564Z8K5_HYMDI|nr:unnamed protein product [Hymenolepis diminuta]